MNRNTTLEFYRSELRHLALMPSVLESLHIDIPASKRIRNPTYQDRNPDVVVKNNFVYDFGTGESLDLLAVLESWGGMTKDQGIKFLADMAGLTCPVNVEYKIKPVHAKPLPEPEQANPSEFSQFVWQARDAFLYQTSAVAQQARAYFESRGLFETPFLCNVGVVDHTITARMPSNGWGGLVVMPTLEYGELLAVKARNTIADAALRVYRNLTGACVPLYNLESALEASESELWLVEGEVDTLSVLEAFELDAPVAGIAGTSNWKRGLERVEFGNRKLIVCLDGDEAGQKATRDILAFARDRGVPAFAANIGEADKNDVLKLHGKDTLRALMGKAFQSATHSTRARLQGAWK